MVGTINELRGRYAFDRGADRGTSTSYVQNGASSSRQSVRPAKDPIVIDSDEEEYDLERKSKRIPAGTRSIKSEDHDLFDEASRAKDSIRIKLSKLDAEIKSVVEQLEPLQQLHTSLTVERQTLEAQLSSLSRQPTLGLSANTQKPGASRSKGEADYQSSSYPWSPAVMSVLKKTFGLTSFRLCQEGVINAAMDGRDIVCVMPTGGGKSLTYQLPAIAGSKGLTVVISPLLALIWDQVRALKELGVECAMLTGSTSKAEQNEIYERIQDGPRANSKELKLVYLTPEKVSKSKRLMSVLERANAGGRLKRFVIDEAHCCSQLGHDFRPDYKKLSSLKTLFPRVPIQAVTATLSSKTMPDLLKILRLSPITDGRSANASGTVFFSAPLFRPNLHYKVIPKASNAKTAIAKMGEWINENHPGASGIIYCFSKKDAETVAEQLAEWSKGAIKTGVYHAGIDEWQKERIHLDWRKGKVDCICATIAFGLGIDKGDVRYVIHHSMSKTLEGYYQETGRAGRDGEDSDCVLFYRGQDASKLASMVYNDVDGSGKLQEMLRFAQDLKTCRKVAFAKYFSASTQLSAAAWDNADALAASGGKITTCGICDNCVRDPSSIITKDVTIESWKILRVLQEVEKYDGRVTLANAADLVRGLGGGSFSVLSTGKRKRAEPEKGSLDLEHIVGGKITLNKDDVETLLTQLTLTGYVREYYSATAYSVNVYIQPGKEAVRLSRLNRRDVEGGSLGVKIECTFPNPDAKPKKIKKKAEKKVVDIEEDGQTNHEKAGKQRQKKDSKSTKMIPDNDDDDLERQAIDYEDAEDDHADDYEAMADMIDDDDDNDIDDGSSDRENGWKVVRGSASGQVGKIGMSSKRAISLSDSE